MIVKLRRKWGTLQNTIFDAESMKTAPKKLQENIFCSAMHLLNFSLQYVAGRPLIRFQTFLILGLVCFL